MADRIRILIVDDEPALLEIGKLFLEQSGEFSVDTVISAAEALDALTRKNYDAIVSDYQMPEMDGINFLKIIRTSDKIIPFIIFTGRSREEIVIDALNNGADFYLQKGGDTKSLYLELVHVIRQSVKMRQSAITLAEQEQRFHDLQNANDLIQSVAPDGHFLFVNKKWLDTLGYEEHDVPDLTVFDVIDKESLSHCMETFQRVMSGENVGIIDAVFRNRDGMKVYVEGIANCKIVEGQPQYTRGIFKDVTESRKTREALRESGEMFRALFENANDAITVFGFTPEGQPSKFINVNENACRMSGYSREDMLTLSPQDLDEPNELAESRGFTQQLIEQGHLVFERTLVRKEGKKIPIEISAHIFSLNNKRVLLSLLRDITRRKSAEEELRRSYAVLKGIIESPKEVVIFALDRQYRYTAFNKNHSNTMKQIWGVDIALGISMTEYITNPDDRKKAIVNFDRALSGESFTLVETYGDPGFDRRQYEDIYNPVTDENGNVIGLAVILTEVTDRRVAEEALRESEEQYRSLAEQVHDGIYIYRGNHFVFVNSLICRMTGYSKDELYSTDFASLVHPDDRAFVQEMSERRQRGEQVPNVYEIRIVTKSGDVLYAELAVSTILFKGEHSVLGSARDITERKRAEKALQKANQKLTLLSSITRHDINNQLLTLKGFVELLHMKIDDPSFEHYFNRITEAGNQITAMIRFTKEYEEVGVKAPYWQNIQSLVNRAGEGITLGQVTLKNDLPANTEVFADPLIVKVIFNLVDNALRHGGDITEIRFSCNARNGNRIIVCEDDGIGVNNDEKEIIFDLGFGKNTGFGLAISREILDITSITIKETGQPGEGARFELTVPEGQFRSITP